MTTGKQRADRGAWTPRGRALTETDLPQWGFKSTASETERESGPPGLTAAATAAVTCTVVRRRRGLCGGPVALAGAAGTRAPGTRALGFRPSHAPCLCHLRERAGVAVP